MTTQSVPLVCASFYPFVLVLLACVHKRRVSIEVFYDSGLNVANCVAFLFHDVCREARELIGAVVADLGLDGVSCFLSN